MKDGEEALRFLEKRSEYGNAPKADTILLDLAIPRVKGLDVLKSVREQTDIKDSPVIILTTSKSLDDIARCHELGIVAYLTKPMNLEDFEALVRHLTEVDFPKLGWVTLQAEK